jgi:bacterial/archaeal transporter family-2 protein
VRLPTLAAVLAGAALAVQARLNGELTGRIGSAELVTLISFVEGTVLLTAIALARGVRLLALARRRGLRPWWLSGGPLGAALIVAISAGVPKLGVAVVTVLTVVGQTVAGVVLDAAGHGPDGRMPVTRRRVGAVALAVAALAIAAIGARTGNVSGAAVGVLAAVLVAAGIASSLQQAANGAVTGWTRDPVVAALISFALGTLVMAVAVAVVALAWPARVDGAAWPGADEAWLYAGGLAGTAFVVTTAWVVRRLGVLTVALATVSGQLLGAVILDGVTGGNGIDAATVVASLAVLAAVALAGLPAGTRLHHRRLAAVAAQARP